MIKLLKNIKEFMENCNKLTDDGGRCCLACKNRNGCQGMTCDWELKTIDEWTETFL